MVAAVTPGGVTDHLGRSVDVQAILLVDATGAAVTSLGGGGLSNSEVKTFFTAQSANGNYDVAWGGGPGIVWLVGNWGTGPTTVQISYSADGVTFVPTDGALVSADATINVAYGPGTVRATIAAAGGGTSLTGKILSSR